MKRFVITNTRAIYLCLVIGALSATNLAYGQDEQPISDRKNIRFYKVNKDMQGDRIMLTEKKSTNVGCHNFLKQVRVHKTVQTGFYSCSLYSEKDCPIPSLVRAATEKNPRKSFLLTEGLGWLTKSNKNPRGFKVKSWRCDMKADLSLLVRESELAALEVIRLNKVSSRSKMKAEEAQKKADKAEKTADDAKKQAALALKKAVDAGYKPPPAPGAKLKVKKKNKKDEELTDPGDEGAEDESEKE